MRARDEGDALAHEIPPPAPLLKEIAGSMDSRAAPDGVERVIVAPGLPVPKVDIITPPILSVPETRGPLRFVPTVVVRG